MTCSWWCICCSSAQLTSRWNLFVFRASFLPLSSLRCLSSSQPFSMHLPAYRQSRGGVPRQERKPVVYCCPHLFISLLGFRRSRTYQIKGSPPLAFTRKQPSAPRPRHAVISSYVFPLFTFATFQFQLNCHPHPITKDDHFPFGQ